MKSKIKIIIIVIAMLLLIVLSIVRVPDGYIKIAKPQLLTKDVKILSPGLHLLPPFLYSFKKFSTSPTEIESADDFSVTTRIGSTRKVSYLISYQIDVDNLPLLKNTGGEPAGYLLKKSEEIFKKHFLSRDAGDPSSLATHQKELKQKLTDTMASTGIRILSVTVKRLSIDYGSVRRNELARLKTLWEKRKRKIVLVGLDALDIKIMTPLLNSGDLPNFAKVIRGGSYGVLKSIRPILSPLIWTTIATGMTPDKHGILDFLARDENGRMVPVTSRQRKVPAIWNILSEIGIPVGFVSWWASWPAEEVNGFVVSDRLAYQLFNIKIDPETLKNPKGKIYPPAEYAKLSRLFTPIDNIDHRMVSRFIDISRSRWEKTKNLKKEIDDEVVFVRNLIASTETYHSVALDLYKRYKPVLFSVYFEGTDTVAHYFMEYYPPKRKNISEADFQSYKRGVPEYYKYIDKKIADYINLVDENTDLIILSDHGFKSGVDRPIGSARINTPTGALWHDIEGTIICYGPSFKKGYLIKQASVYDVMPTLLAMLGLPAGKEMPGKVLHEVFKNRLHDEPRLPDYAALVPVHGDSKVAGESEDNAEIMRKLARLGYISPDTGQTTEEGKSLLSAVNHAFVLIERKEYKKAEKILLDVVSKEPKLVTAWFNLAAIYRETGQKQKEADTYIKILENSADQGHIENALVGAAIVLYDLNKIDRATGLLKRGLGKYPDSYNLNLHMGKILLDTGQYRTSISHLKKALEIKPDDIAALNNIALAHFNIGEETEANRYWSRSFKLKPEQLKDKTINYYLNLGLVYLKQQDYRKALETFQTALARNPKQYRIWTTLGNIQIHMKNYKSAEDSYKKALQLSKEKEIRANAYLGLVVIYNSQNRKDLEIEAIKAGLKEDEKNYMLHRFHALYLLKNKNWEGAIREYERVLELKSDDWNAMNRLGALYAQKGRKQEALGLFKKSLRINPNQPRIRQALQQMERSP